MNLSIDIDRDYLSTMMWFMIIAAATPCWRMLCGRPFKIRTWIIFILIPVIPIAAIILTIVVNILYNLPDFIRVSWKETKEFLSKEV